MNRQNPTQRNARLFHLVRHADVSGVSGTGTVAEGVEWSDGAVALRWRGQWAATSVWDDGLDAVLAVHGHGGSTKVSWLAVPLVPPVTTVGAEPAADVKYPRAAGLRVPTASVDGLCVRCGRGWPCLNCSEGDDP